MNISKNVPLKNYTTIRIGGPAKFFCEPSSVNELVNILRWGKQQQLPYLILGGGSNILFSDDGYAGLVIKPNFDNLSIEGDTVHVGATVSLAKLISDTLAHNLVGLEFAAGIPGTVGGAIYGNAGSYGQAISAVVHTVTTLEENNLSITLFSNKACQFGYRDSIFKHHRHIITASHIELQRGDAEQSKEVITNRLTKRSQLHPHEPSAGCIFKNIPISTCDTRILQTQDIDISQYVPYGKIPTGLLIERLGLKGKQIGDAQISDQHANYIINIGSATCRDVLTLISLVKQQVRDIFHIQLEEEVQIISEY